MRLTHVNVCSSAGRQIMKEDVSCESCIRSVSVPTSDGGGGY